MLYSHIYHYLVAPRGLSLTAIDGLAVTRPRGFRRSVGPATVGTASTTAAVHAVIPHTRVNSITLVLQNCFGTTEQYCSRDVSLEPNFVAFVYIEISLISNYISISVVFGIPWFNVMKRGLKPAPTIQSNYKTLDIHHTS